MLCLVHIHVLVDTPSQAMANTICLVASVPSSWLFWLLN